MAKTFTNKHRGFWAMAALGLTAIIVGACTPGPDGSQTLSQLKRSHYGTIAQQEATMVANGNAQPAVEFRVEDTPPSIFVNWVIPDAQAAAFTAAVGLPGTLPLAKVRILESDPVPQYWLSLNVYRVGGLTTGMRAEWSTYVDDGSGNPRFMIVEARAAEGSIDPLGPIAYPEPFMHGIDGGGLISTAMNKTVMQNGQPVLTPDNLFNSTVQLPAPIDQVDAVPTREWVAANDFIFWLNGVNDRTFQNETAHSAPLISVDLGDVTLDDESEFVPFLSPSPEHVLVYLDKIEFIISPWWNVTETDGHVDALTLSQLRPYKASLYSGLLDVQAINIKSGLAQPLVQSGVGDAPRSVDWHWEIDAGELAAFEAAANLPPSVSLAPIRLQESDGSASHWLTLNVSEASGQESGLRSEWRTYVDGGDGVRSIVLDSSADHVRLNPVDRFAPASPITHTDVLGAVDTTIGSGPEAFTSSFVVPGSPATILASRELVSANEVRYWSNGIFDRLAHDSTVFSPKTSINPATVGITDGGPLAAFVGASADRVWVSDESSDYVTSPWANVG